MSIKTRSNFIEQDANQFDVTSLVDLKLKVNPTGGLQFGATGLEQVVPDTQNTRGTLDPANGTIALPTAGGAETVVSNGTAFVIGDNYIVNSDGTVGGIPVTAGGELVYLGTGTGAADGDWQFRPLSAAGQQEQTDSHTVIAANQTAAPFTITLSATPVDTADVKLIGDGYPSQVNGVGFTVAGTTLTVANALRDLMLVGDELRISYFKL